MGVLDKLLKVQQATRGLLPDASGQTGTASYPYVSGKKLLRNIRPILDQNGLILSQEVLECSNQQIAYNTLKGTKVEMFTTLKIRFTWIDTEDGSMLENIFFANGMNAWDKGLGSALTYAERYYLLKFFHIPTDEDDVDALQKEEATGIAPMPEPYKPMDDESYKKYVAGAARKKSNVEGVPCRQAWIDYTHAGTAEIAAFDEAVAEYRINHNLQ